jgi:hypothetical protein
VATFQKTMPFKQFLRVSHEVKFAPWVKARLLMIHIFSLAQSLLNKMLFCDFA